LIIDNRKIGASEKPYIIAEISANHNGSLARAKRLIISAKKAGADAVKLQTYTAETLTLESTEPDFMISGGLWDSRSLYELYEEAHTPWYWHEELFKTAKDHKITIFSSPFDRSAVDLLEALDAPAYKIASFEIIDHDLIAYAARTKKPMIISTGLASLLEIEEAVEVAKSNGCGDLALLHCLSSYPAPPEDYKLNTIQALRKKFSLEVGLSDHTIGNAVPTAAIALGATIVEKHFTESVAGGGPDDSFSMDSRGLVDLRTGIDIAWASLGFDDFKRQESEVSNLRFRRSLYFVQDIQANEFISQENVRSIRPGYGVAPKRLNEILGHKMPFPVTRGTAVTQDIFDQIISNS